MKDYLDHGLGALLCEMDEEWADLIRCCRFDLRGLDLKFDSSLIPKKLSQLRSDILFFQGGALPSQTPLKVSLEAS